MFAKHVLYEGNVQGVGFRYATKEIARGFDVLGWVRNLDDGRVEMRVQAYDDDELDAFLAEIEEESNLAHHIKEKDHRDIPHDPEVSGFSIGPDSVSEM